ncbi:MAG: hypothetical protein LKE52_00310 [Bacilli bacterium]|nr:hypothetical protein [Bacilli bacterium]
MKKKIKSLVPFALALSFLMAGCKNTEAKNTSSSSAQTSDSGEGFVFHPGHATSVDDSGNSSSSNSSSSSSSSSAPLDVKVEATIEGDKPLTDPYKIEAEDFDTSHCTLQSGCSSFTESPDNQYPTSGGSCLACIASPSTLAFQINVKKSCDISFYTVCAKWENPWPLDENVVYSFDSEDDPFVSGFTEFGHTEENLWYNWKTVKLGEKKAVAAGIHQINISVRGAFPDTDCFLMSVKNYQA